MTHAHFAGENVNLSKAALLKAVCLATVKPDPTKSIFDIKGF